jgi:hypothetical protein
MRSEPRMIIPVLIQCTRMYANPVYPAAVPQKEALL